MSRIKSETRVGNPVEISLGAQIGQQLTALSLSLAAFAFASVGAASAADAPLPIKRIALNKDNQIVVYFGKREGEFPTPPHLLETPGANHRIVLEFNDATVDKTNMPAAGDLSTRIHKQLAGIKSIRYSSATVGDTTKARIVIELPEQLKVRPRVVKLEEESVTINLADDIVEQSAAFEEPTKTRSQSSESSTSGNVASRARKTPALPAADSANDNGAVIEPQVSSAAEAPLPVAQNSGTEVVPAAAPVVASADTGSSDAPVLRPAEPMPATAAVVPAENEAANTAGATSTKKTAVSHSSEKATGKREASKPSLKEKTHESIASAGEKMKNAGEKMNENFKNAGEKVGDGVKNAGEKVGEGFKSASENIKSASKNASTNLKKIVRWPHKGDDDKFSDDEKSVAHKASKSKTEVAKAEPEKKETSAKKGSSTTVADAMPQPASAPSPSADAMPVKDDNAPPEGAEFGGAAVASDKISDKTASAPAAVASTKPGAPEAGAASSTWDWTAKEEAKAGGDQAKTAESVKPAAEAAPAPGELPATAAASTQTQAQGAGEAMPAATPAPAAERQQIASAPVAVTPVSIAAADTVVTAASSAVPSVTPVTTGTEAVPSKVAQSDSPAVDDRPKISTPIETTTTTTFNEPAQMLQSGANTSISPGAASMMNRDKPEEKKPVTVAETESSDFAEALKPAKKAKPEVEPAPTEIPIRDTEMSDAAAALSTEAAEKPQAMLAAAEPVKTHAKAATTAVASAPAPTAVPEPSVDSAKAALALYNSAVKAHLNGNLPKAIQDYKGAVAANPELAEAHSNLGLIYNQQHQYAQAVTEFRKALAINPKDAITYNGIGAALRAQKDLSGAINNWQTAVSLDPKLATAHYNLGVAYELQRDYDRALNSYDEAVNCDHRLGEAFYRQGLILEKRHRIDEAKAKFKAALKASSNSEYSADARQKIATLEGSKN
jgi:tetratricopeptide (TPR) repeat protein